jgi:NAD(P)H-dependent FMN reductase
VIVIISGTNRPGANSLRIATHLRDLVEDLGEEVRLLDLAQLPAELFAPAAYAEKPAAFAPFQEAILAADGVLTVVGEYNGSFPGVLKYFIDMLRFPESLYGVPAAFVGVAAGEWGGLRAVEQLEMVFQYRHAHLYGRRVFIKNVAGVLDEAGGIADGEILRRLAEQAEGFVDFCRRMRG